MINPLQLVASKDSMSALERGTLMHHTGSYIIQGAAVAFFIGALFQRNGLGQIKKMADVAETIN